METTQQTLNIKPIKRPFEWGLKEMEEDLLASGAIEITPEQMKQERFQKLMKNVKQNGKFVCE